MKPHKVISAFKHAGQRIAPPGMWTPPSVAVAEKLVRAGCLKGPSEAMVQVANITLNADTFSRDAVLNLAGEINNAVAEQKETGQGQAPDASPAPKVEVIVNGGASVREQAQQALDELSGPAPEPPAPKSRRRKK